MKATNSSGVPVYVKEDENMPWPEDKFFYMVTANGLFRCRNHPFFQSCSKVKGDLKELVSQESFLVPNYPKIPRLMLEKVVGFFHLVAEKQASEAAALLFWNRQEKQVELLIPEQTATNSSSGYALDVKYTVPTVPPHLLQIGDIHSHVYMGAFASGTDTSDETHRAGIHLIVGKIDKEPPEWNCEVIADGTRYKVELSDVIEGYHQRITEGIPKEWVDRVKLKKEKPWSSSYGSSYGGSYGSYDWQKEERELLKKDEEIVRKILSQKAAGKTCPHFVELRSQLFQATRRMSHDKCEKKAEKFIAAWPKIKENQANETTEK